LPVAAKICRTWSLSVTRNWRITLRIGEAEGEILDLDFEDYH
jgi:toxin HigB-1